MKCSIVLVYCKNMDSTQNGQEKIEAFGTQYRRKTLKISWTDKVRNKDVYLKINET